MLAGHDCSVTACCELVGEQQSSGCGSWGDVGGVVTGIQSKNDWGGGLMKNKHYTTHCSTMMMCCRNHQHKINFQHMFRSSKQQAAGGYRGVPWTNWFGGPQLTSSLCQLPPLLVPQIPPFFFFYLFLSPFLREADSLQRFFERSHRILAYIGLIFTLYSLALFLKFCPTIAFCG